MTTAYGAAFYAERRQATRHAADRILSVVAQHIPFKRVADVGCGTGTWLAAALDRGAQQVFGYEGSWVAGVPLDDARIALVETDLERRLGGEPVDLVISLEVAEHLSPARADGFVADLCAMAPAVLFSAAIPGQGGVNHVNEQWQSYWATRFADRGYRAFDIVRPAVWSDSSVPAWYRQNAVLYATEQLAATLSASAVSDLGTLNLVHPALWQRANRELEYANALPESAYLQVSRAS